MSLDDRLVDDMKKAMKDKDKVKLTVIRGIRSALNNEAIKLGHDLSEDEELVVLNREVKQRKDSLQEYKNAGRDDLVSSIEQELETLKAYMPEQLSEDDLKQLIHDTVEEVGATSPSDMGSVMKALMPKVKGKADGSLVNRLVKEYLS